VEFGEEANAEARLVGRIYAVIKRDLPLAKVSITDASM
jgi:hypothetical protein